MAQGMTGAATCRLMGDRVAPMRLGWIGLAVGLPTFAAPLAVVVVDAWRHGCYSSNSLQSMPWWMGFPLLLFEVLAALHVTVPVVVTGAVLTPVGLGCAWSATRTALTVAMGGFAWVAAAQWLYRSVCPQPAGLYGAMGLACAVTMSVAVLALYAGRHCSRQSDSTAPVHTARPMAHDLLPLGAWWNRDSPARRKRGNLPRVYPVARAHPRY